MAAIATHNKMMISVVGWYHHRHFTWKLLDVLKPNQKIYYSFKVIVSSYLVYTEQWKVFTAIGVNAYFHTANAPNKPTITNYKRIDFHPEVETTHQELTMDEGNTKDRKNAD